MERIQTAVIGVGLFGEYHVKTYAEYARSELVAVCDLNEARAKEVAEQYGCRYTTDLREIAEDPDIRAVSVATPDFAHRDPVMQMLEAGKHVLVEKPLATTAGEAREMVQTAKTHGGKLMVDFQNRWSPPFVRAKEEIRSGAFGEPVMGYGRLANTLSVPTEMLSWAGKSGPQWFLFPHLIDLVKWLFDERAVRVYAVGQREILKAKGIDAYDAIQAIVTFERATATFETSWVIPNGYPSVIDFNVVLYGTTGRIGIKADHQGIEITGEQHVWPFVLAMQDAHGHTSGFVQYPIMHFVDCVADNKEPLGTGEEGFEITAIIEAIERSIEEKRIAEVERL